MPLRCLRAKRGQRAPERWPSRPCATARQTSSESVSSGGRDTTALRRRLLLLSGRLWWRPYRETVPSVPAACSELRQLVCVHGAVRAA